jgi:hypothetical protein
MVVAPGTFVFRAFAVKKCVGELEKPKLTNLIIPFGGQYPV